METLKQLMSLSRLLGALHKLMVRPYYLRQYLYNTLKTDIFNVFLYVQFLIIYVFYVFYLICSW